MKHFVIDRDGREFSTVVLVLGAAAIFLALLSSTSVSSAWAQGIDDGVERIWQEQEKIFKSREEMAKNIEAAQKLIQGLVNGNLDGDERLKAIEAVYSSIEADTRAVLDLIALNSDFRDALDDMRAKFETLIARNLMEPESPEREARLQRLYELREEYQKGYDSIGKIEGNLIKRLGELAAQRRSARRDAEVGQVENIVAAIKQVVEGLQQMDEDLATIASTAYGSPSVAQ